MEKKKIFTIRRLIVVIFLVLFAIGAYVSYRGSFLEFKELGENYLETFLTKQKYQYNVMVFNFIFIFLIMYFSGRRIKKVITKEMGDLSQEVLLVIDSTTGQNAINQVKAFKQETDVTGLVLTKLDGTSKGGVVCGIVEENKIPVKFIGVGEQIDDMEIFNSEDFAKAII